MEVSFAFGLSDLYGSGGSLYFIRFAFGLKISFPAVEMQP